MSGAQLEFGLLSFFVEMLLMSQHIYYHVVM